MHINYISMPNSETILIFMHYFINNDVFNKIYEYRFVVNRWDENPVLEKWLTMDNSTSAICIFFLQIQELF